jgi:DNA-binding HxlR family transcriptional regulator
VLLYFWIVKKEKIDYRSNCPISTALDIFGDKWSLLIVRDLAFKGRHTYGDFLNGGEKIATNTLADRLLMLEIGGIITKKTHPDSKAKFLYQLTDKGINLVPTLVEMIIWSEQHHDVDAQATNFVGELQQDKAGVLKSIMANLRQAAK